MRLSPETITQLARLGDPEACAVLDAVVDCGWHYRQVRYVVSTIDYFTFDVGEDGEFGMDNLQTNYAPVLRFFGPRIQEMH